MKLEEREEWEGGEERTACMCVHYDWGCIKRVPFFRILNTTNSLK